MKTETQVVRGAFYLGAGGHGAWKAPLQIHQQRRPVPPSQPKGLDFSVNLSGDAQNATFLRLKGSRRPFLSSPAVFWCRAVSSPEVG